ncbi:hypothetical protein SBDP1_1050016 [Syntrophobacter sp. SbD1]|nr:hypothetical protein SBDP1_1050016 [Syntrophobacter sp. SbD1]
MAPDELLYSFSAVVISSAEQRAGYGSCGALMDVPDKEARRQLDVNGLV